MKKYLLKFPDPTREIGKKEELSYINNVFSEYIGCMIAKSIGLSVQDVILGEYTFTEKDKTVPACACGDIRRGNEMLYEVDKQELGSFMDERDRRDITFESVNEIFSILEKYGLNKAEFEEFYFNTFVFDALIGNTDRHNGNWGFLMAPGHPARIAPIYDCGSSLFPIASDDMVEQGNIQNIAMGICSAVKDENLHRINYHDFFVQAENEQINAALKRIFPKINMNVIYDIIDNTPYLSDVRRNFYKTFINTNYEQTLIKGLVNILAKEIPVKQELEQKPDYYSFYQKNIRQIKNLPEFTPQTVTIEGKNFPVMKVSSQYAITFDENGATSIFYLQSSNDRTKRTAEIFEYLGVKTNLWKNTEDIISVEDDYYDYDR